MGINNKKNNKDITVTARLSEEEKRHLDQAVQDSGKKQSEIIRNAIMGMVVMDCAKHETERLRIIALSKLSLNVGRIATVLENDLRYGVIDVYRYEEVTGLLIEYLEQLRELLCSSE